eukprot:gene11265-biopygen8190
MQQRSASKRFEWYTRSARTRRSSLRKGAVLHLAHKGARGPTDAHTTPVNTLRKYLGYGRQLTAEGVAAQANAGLLHPEQSS